MWKWARRNAARGEGPRREDEREEAAVPAQTDEPTCAACGRPLFWAGPPAEENGRPICAECDAANNFDVLE